jgi:hypothetical protein
VVFCSSGDWSANALLPLEPRLLLSVETFAGGPATEILSDLTATEVSLLPGEDSEGLTLDDGVVETSDLTWTQRLDVLVEPGLLTTIQPSLDVYVADLSAEGYTVTVQEFTGDAAGLRAHLQDRYTSAGIEGALLVGDLPTLTFRNDNDFNGQTVSFLHDMYFMDLDGEYVLHSDSTPDEHFDGTGDVGPEIYVSRLTTSPIASMTGRSEEQLMIDYLDRVHDYRTGALTYADRSVLWADDDWAWSEYKLGDLYDEHLVISNDDQTTRQSYLDTLSLNYESILELIHSSVTYHQVSGSGGGKVTSTDVYNANPRIGFYNLWNCSSGKFTQSNNLISTYVYAGDFGLNAVGSTKTGSMLYPTHFYNDQADGLSVGQAFANTMDRYAAETTTDGTSRSWVNWYYGMTMQGDPTLRPAVMGEPSAVIEIASPSADEIYLADETNLLLLDARLTEGSFTEGPATLTWSVSTAPDEASVAFESASSWQTAAQFSQPGAYVLRAEATDGLQTVWDELAVTVLSPDDPAPANVAALVNAGADMHVESNEVILAGSASDDGNPADPGELHCEWQLLDGPGQAYLQDASNPASEANVDAFGEYTFRLTVDDGQAVTADDVRVILAATGDANFDGVVDFDDAWTLLSHYSVSGEQTWQQGDFNGDGLVDAADAAELQSNMGTDLTALLATAGPYRPQTDVPALEPLAAEPIEADGLSKPTGRATLAVSSFATAPKASRQGASDVPVPAGESQADYVRADLSADIDAPFALPTTPDTGTFEPSAWGSAQKPGRPARPADLGDLEDVLNLTALKAPF